MINVKIIIGLMKKSDKELSAESLTIAFVDEPPQQGWRMLARLISRAYLREQQGQNGDKASTKRRRYHYKKID